MICQINNGIFISSSMIFKDKFILISNCIGKLSSYCTGITLITIRRYKFKTNRSRLFRNNGSCPDSFIKTFKTTMKRIWTIVNSKLIIFAIDSELTLTNTMRLLIIHSHITISTHFNFTGYHIYQQQHQNKD